jgi:hypothetical protein
MGLARPNMDAEVYMNMEKLELHGMLAPPVRHVEETPGALQIFQQPLEQQLTPQRRMCIQVFRHYKGCVHVALPVHHAMDLAAE